MGQRGPTPKPTAKPKPKKPVKSKDKARSPEFEQRKWKPGQSGNPKGKPSNRKILNEILEKFGVEYPEDKDGKKSKLSRNEMLVLATYRLATKGNAAALNQLWDRIDGKVKLPVEVDATIRRHGVMVVPGIATDQAEWEQQSKDHHTPQT